MQGTENYEREKALYDGIVLEYLELEDIVRNKGSSGEPFNSSLHGPLPAVVGHLEWWWKCKLRGPVLRQVRSHFESCSSSWKQHCWCPFATAITARYAKSQYWSSEKLNRSTIAIGIVPCLYVAGRGTSIEVLPVHLTCLIERHLYIKCCHWQC